VAGMVRRVLEKIPDRSCDRVQSIMYESTTLQEILPPGET
jgi:hypothetical protein